MLDMASAYAIIANGGVRIDPTPVLTITNSKGEVIVDNTTPDTSLSKTHREQVISPEVAHAATEVMKTVVNTSEGTGQEAGAAERPGGGGEDGHVTEATRTSRSAASRRRWRPPSGLAIPATR